MSLRLSKSMTFQFHSVGVAVYSLVIICLLGLLVNHAQAKTIVYGSGVETVKIKYGESTIFRFPKSVQTITGAGRLQIKPANKVNPSYEELEVIPKFTNGTNDVLFFLTDRSVVKTKIIVSPTDPASEGLYDFKSRESADLGDAENAPIISEIELLKAMARDDSVSGYKVSRLSQIFPSKVFNAQTELIRIYQGSPFNGYVFRIRNTSWSKVIDIDVRHITVGDPSLAILSQSDETTVYPKGRGVNETLVRVVAKNTASSNEVILAMETQDENHNKKGE